MNAIDMLIACGRHQQGDGCVLDWERPREVPDTPRVMLPSDHGIAGAYALPSVEQPESVALVHDNPVIR